jgi:hypothetical protein
VVGGSLSAVHVTLVLVLSLSDVHVTLVLVLSLSAVHVTLVLVLSLFSQHNHNCRSRAWTYEMNDLSSSSSRGAATTAQHELGDTNNGTAQTSLNLGGKLPAAAAAPHQ